MSHGLTAGPAGAGGRITDGMHWDDKLANFLMERRFTLKTLWAHGSTWS
jgi:hypothetical protein